MIMVNREANGGYTMPAGTAPPALVDSEGRPLFTCTVCHGPLAHSDLDDFGLRAPDYGESAEEYCDAELVDPRELRHRAPALPIAPASL
jgi:hypothetical protein